MPGVSTWFECFIDADRVLAVFSNRDMTDARAHMGFYDAMRDIDQGKGATVPRNLQNTHFDGKDAKVKGQHYLYPHDFDNHYVEQQYLPDDVQKRKYYQYQDNKYEQTLKEYWEKIKKGK